MCTCLDLSWMNKADKNVLECIASVELVINNSGFLLMKCTCLCNCLIQMYEASQIFFLNPIFSQFSCSLISTWTTELNTLGSANFLIVCTWANRCLQQIRVTLINRDERKAVNSKLTDNALSANTNIDTNMRCSIYLLLGFLLIRRFTGHLGRGSKVYGDSDPVWHNKYDTRGFYFHAKWDARYEACRNKKCNKEPL